MKISSAAIKDGNFEDKYGAKGTDFANKLPALSIPFEISEVPITAESFVVILKDDNPFRLWDNHGRIGPLPT